MARMQKEHADTLISQRVYFIVGLTDSTGTISELWSLTPRADVPIIYAR